MLHDSCKKRSNAQLHLNASQPTKKEELVERPSGFGSSNAVWGCNASQAEITIESEFSRLQEVDQLVCPESAMMSRKMEARRLRLVLKMS